MIVSCNITISDKNRITMIARGTMNVIGMVSLVFMCSIGLLVMALTIIGGPATYIIGCGDSHNSELSVHIGVQIKSEIKGKIFCGSEVKMDVHMLPRVAIEWVGLIFWVGVSILISFLDRKVTFFMTCLIFSLAVILDMLCMILFYYQSIGFGRETSIYPAIYFHGEVSTKYIALLSLKYALTLVGIFLGYFKVF